MNLDKWLGISWDEICACFIRSDASEIKHAWHWTGSDYNTNLPKNDSDLLTLNMSLYMCLSTNYFLLINNCFHICWAPSFILMEFDGYFHFVWGRNMIFKRKLPVMHEITDWVLNKRVLALKTDLIVDNIEGGIFLNLRNQVYKTEGLLGTNIGLKNLKYAPWFGALASSEIKIA